MLQLGRWHKLTADHRFKSNTSERERVERAAAGGQSVQTRLFGLNISRMLGDRFFKEQGMGFIAEPHISATQVGGGGCGAARCCRKGVRGQGFRISG
jgi:serine/threonine protein phosphatase PrpC